MYIDIVVVLIYSSSTVLFYLSCDQNYVSRAFRSHVVLFLICGMPVQATNGFQESAPLLSEVDLNESEHKINEQVLHEDSPHKESQASYGGSPHKETPSSHEGSPHKESPLSHEGSSDKASQASYEGPSAKESHALRALAEQVVC